MLHWHELRDECVLRPRPARWWAALSQFFHEHRKAFFTTVILIMCCSNLVHDARLLVATPDRVLSAPTAPRGLAHHDHPQPQQQSPAVDVVQLARLHKEPPSSIRTAICFKTLFGDVDIGLVLQWLAYHRLLGFDHMFLWYRPEMIDSPRFAELQALPFVTLTENTEGSRKDYYNQWYTEKKCLSRQEFAGSYDWALLADIDEYMWFAQQPMGVKDFLLSYQEKNITYVSLGKYMYTLDHRGPAAEDSSALTEDTRILRDHRLDATAPGWAVTQYPFYLPHFCYHEQRRGDPHCPTWRGRAKVMVQPKHHQRVDVHGTIFHPNPSDGTIHVDSDTVAHFKEWPSMFGLHNVTLRSNTEAFAVEREEEVHIHNLWRAFQPANTTADGTKTYVLQHDAALQDWFSYVQSRAIIDG